MSNNEPISFCTFDSPVGSLLMGGTNGRLEFLHFEKEGKPVEPKAAWVKDPAPYAKALSELEDYFAGTLKVFSVAYHLNGTEFQRSVWQALLDIPYGALRSYGDIARTVGQPGGAQAVGMANNANPLPIIVPCHRVIGADGSLVGFGGGIKTKIWLLEHEGISPSQVHSPSQMGFQF